MHLSRVGILTGGFSAIGLFIVLYLADVPLDLCSSLSALLGILLYGFVSRLSGKADTFHPLIFIGIYFLLYFECRGIYIVTSPYAHRIGRFFYDDYLSYAAWCAVVGYLATLLGFHSRFGTYLSSKIHIEKLQWPRKVQLAPIVAMAAIGTASFLYLAAAGVTVGNVKEIEQMNQSNPVSGIPVLLSIFINVALCALFIAYGEETDGKRKFLIRVLLLFCVSVLIARVVISGSKQTLLEPLLDLAMVYHYTKRRLRVRQLLTAILPIALISFGLLNTYRFVIIAESGGAPKSLEDLLARLSYAGRYFLADQSGDPLYQQALDSMLSRDHGIDSLAVTIRYTPERRPYSLGEDWIDLPLQAFAPRQLLPDKRIRNASDDFERDFLGLTQTGWSSPHVIADLFQNFHLAGVVLGMFLLGVFLRAFYAASSPTTSILGALVYSTLLPAIVHGFEFDVSGLAIMTMRLLVIGMLVAMLLGRRATTGRKKFAKLAGNVPLPNLSRS